jgi:hypothetical protein
MGDAGVVALYGEFERAGAVHELDISNRTRNALLCSARCLGERGFAPLSQRWLTLQYITASPENWPHRQGPHSS